MAADGIRESLEEENEYITEVEKIIRQFTIDKFPNLFNVVVRGKMDLVDPRPPHHTQHDFIKIRIEVGIHKVKPRIAGYAQIMKTGGGNLVEKASVINIMLSI